MFNLRKIINGRMNVPEMELLPVTASESFVMGEALVLSSGKLTKASGTTKPTHIAAKDYSAPASGAEKLPCYRIAKIWFCRSRNLFQYGSCGCSRQ